MKVIAAILSCLAILLIGCTTVPKAIREAPPGNLDFAAVQADTDAYVGKPVRWGGTILSIKNQPADTWIEILEQPLGAWGRPKPEDSSRGRFFSRFDGFIDPEVYRQGREITVVGTVQKTLNQRIGEHEYRYAVIDADEHYLWNIRPLYEPYYFGKYPYFWHHRHYPHGFYFRHGPYFGYPYYYW